MDERPTHLDLFSGIGGFSLAFEAAGFRTIGFAETDPYASSVLREHWPDVPNFGDVRSIWLHKFFAENGRPHCITGGVPCQPASLIGERLGDRDERWLWPEAIGIIRELRPPFALFENPPALLTLDGGGGFNGIVSGLVALGYDLWWEVLPAQSVNAGHLRERLFILASYSDRSRLEGHAGDVKAGRRQKQNRPITETDLLDRKLTSEKWYAQSGIQPVVAGLPGRLVEAALRCVGNSVQPQVAHLFAKAIHRQLAC